MRFAVPLALLFLVGCEPPARLPVAPDLRINSRDQTGSAVSFRDGDSIAIDWVFASCFRKDTLQIQNVGLGQARIRVSSMSPDMEVVSAPESLAPAEDGTIELLFHPIGGLTQPFEATLRVEIDGQQPIHFMLSAVVLTLDVDLPPRFDFGGVEVGSSRTLGTSRFTGLSGDFSETDAGQLQFSPQSLGFQRLDAKYTNYLHCPDFPPAILLGDGVASVLTGPPELDFGDVPSGETHEREIVIVNYSFDPLAIQVADPFTLVSATTPDVATRPSLDLVPGSSTFRLRFSPASTGAVAQELTVTAGSKTLLIPLRGNGVP